MLSSLDCPLASYRAHYRVSPLNPLLDCLPSIASTIFIIIIIILIIVILIRIRPYSYQLPFESASVLPPSPLEPPTNALTLAHKTYDRVNDHGDVGDDDVDDEQVQKETVNTQ